MRIEKIKNDVNQYITLADIFLEIIKGAFVNVLAFATANAFVVCVLSN